uniref:Uncharacterized protein n=1 Tax=Rhizophagus irregularis (strain DAOM 181602 / DAOM 197198 / MUCL 43194) TaxID=747089 RepID=U9UIY4_RHIID
MNEHTHDDDVSTGGGYQEDGMTKNILWNISLKHILLHHNNYKAEEWTLWITLYSLPLLKDHLQVNILKADLYLLRLLIDHHLTTLLEMLEKAITQNSYQPICIINEIVKDTKENTM